MPDSIAEMFIQLPVAGIVLVVVWKFLQVIKERDDNWLSTIRNRDSVFLSELNKYEDRTDLSQKEMIQAFRESTVVMRKCADVMEKVDKKLLQEGFEREKERRHGVL